MDHILVVDDDEIMRSILKDALVSFGYQVGVACNGKEGFKYFNCYHSLKLIITDIRMPFTDGIEFAKLIRDSDRPKMPIIGMTGHFEKENIAGGLFDAILGKPFNLETLKKFVKQTLES